MKVTAKGQVTIPRKIREEMGIVAGTEVEFSVMPDGRVHMHRVVKLGRGKEVVARLLGQGSVRMSTDEIMALTGGRRPQHGKKS